MNDEEKTGLEPLAPLGVGALASFPALIPFLAMSTGAGALTAFGMYVLGSSLAHVVASRSEASLRAGLAKVNADFAALRTDSDWAALTQEARIDHLARALTQEQREQVSEIVEQAFRTQDEERQRHLFALMEDVASGPRGEDATRRKVISEMTRIGTAHLKALREVAQATKFAVRPGIGGSGKASRRQPVTEDAAKDLAKLFERLDEPILDALEGAGFVQVDEFVMQGSRGSTSYSTADAITKGAKLATPVPYVRCTSLGERALRMLKISTD